METHMVATQHRRTATVATTIARTPVGIIRRLDFSPAATTTQVMLTTTLRAATDTVATSMFSLDTTTFTGRVTDITKLDLEWDRVSGFEEQGRQFNRRPCSSNRCALLAIADLGCPDTSRARLHGKRTDSPVPTK